MDGVLDWYFLGVVLGLGVVDGAAAAGAVRRLAYGVVTLAAFGAGAVVAVLTLGWWALLALVAAAAVSWLSLRRLSLEALPAALLGAAALALVPLAGYVAAAAAPLVGRRLGRRARSRYAGLRVLAKD